MFTSDMQLQRMGVKRIDDLPTRVGMRFRGVLRDGSTVPCEVQDGGVIGGDFAIVGKNVTANDLIGWTERPLL